MNATRTPSAGRFGIVYNMAAVVWPSSERVAKLTGKMVSRTVGIAAALMLAASPAFAQTIPTTTTLSASPSPSTFGQSVTLRATVDTEGKAVAAGSVTFKDGTTSLGVVQLQTLGVKIADITAGYEFTCALSTAGKVWCWGSGSIGQLGDGQTNTQTTTPLPVPDLGNVVRLTAGREHACALLVTGSVKCWGRASEGQLGNGSNLNSSTAVLVSNLSNAIAIDAGDFHTCAMTRTGGVKCWGAGASGQLGNGGTQNQNQPVDVIGLTGATTISAGSRHTCAVVTEGAATCWGQGAHGQLGTGNDQGHTTPVAVVGLTGAISITAGGVHTCALFASGSVKCWGNGERGQLGNGSQDYQPAPVDVLGILDATKITSTYLHTCALLANATVKCWGEGDDGQLGDGGAVIRSTPVETKGGRNATLIAAGETHTCAVINDGTVNCWGSSTSGELGFTPVSNTATAKTVDGLSGATAVVAGAAHTCALVTGGAVRCFGNGQFGQLGNGLTVSSSSPVEVSSINFQLLTGASLLAAGANHTCAIRTGINVVCWGKGDAGQLGDGNLGNVAFPVPVSLIGSPSAISAGGDTTCVILGGQVKCWGEGSDGQLGDGRSVDSALPVTVSGITNAVSIAVGGKFACAVDGSNFSVKCWGKGDEGQLGWGFLSSSATPVLAVPSLSGFPLFIQQIYAGEAHVCGLGGFSISSSVYQAFCWGRGTAGQLGTGAGVSYSFIPLTAVTGLNGTFKVSLGGDTSCAFQSGAVSCWGAGGSGQNGSTTFSSRLTPVALPDLASNVTAMAVGGAHGCAVLTGGTVRCWGANASGQLGQPVPNLPGRIPNFTLANRATASLATGAQQLAGGVRALTATFAPSSAHGVSNAALSHTVNRASQEVTFPQPADQVFVPLGTIAPGASATSGLPVTIATSTPTSCGGPQPTTVSIFGAGTCTITVSQAGNDNYLPASTTRSLQILKAPQTITFAQPAAQLFASGRLVDLPATTTGYSLQVVRASTTPTVCVISGTSALLLGAGTCSVTVSQVGNGNYLAATPVSRSFSITAGLRPEVSALAASARLHEQGFASLAPFGSGAVMAYASRSTATGSFGILRQNLLSTGAATGLPVVVAAPAAGVGAPDVAALTAGYVIVWQGPDGSSTGIFAQRFSATGAALGPVIRVNAVIVGAQSRPRVAALPGGAFAVVWQTTVSATDEDVWLRVVSAAGVPLAGDVRVNTTIVRKQNNPDIAALSTGTIAVTFASETTAGRFSVLHRLFRSTGVPLTAATWTAGLNQALNPTPVIAARTGAGAASGFAIAYAQSEVASVATPANIHVRTLSATGVLAPAIPRANTITAGHQAAPAIAALKAGAFAVAFTTPDGSSTGIGLRLFSTTASALGSEERANTVTALTQSTPALAPLGPAGATRGTTFLSTWTTQSAIAANSNDIAARLFQGP